jgi:hypothetical protein
MAPPLPLLLPSVVLYHRKMGKELRQLDSIACLAAAAAAAVAGSCQMR